MEVFSSQRPADPQELMESIISANVERQANRSLLKEQMILEAEEVKKQGELKKQDEEQKEKEEKEHALESAMQAKRIRDSHVAIAKATAQLPRIAKNAIIKNTLFNVMMDSLWVDDNIKNSTEMQTEAMNVFDGCIAKCDAVTGTSFYNNMHNTKMLSCIDEIATLESNAVVNRILEEAADTDEININFRMNEDEINDTDRKMSDLGTKELSKVIKKKVLKVVEDEKKDGKIKADLFAELDDAAKEEEETLEDTTGEDAGTSDTGDDNVSESVNLMENSNKTGQKLVRRNFIDVMKNIWANTLETGKFEEVQPRLLKIVDSCKTTEEVEYLRRDINANKRTYKQYADIVKDVEHGGKNCTEQQIKIISKRLKKGLTSKKVYDHIKWVETVYTKALSDKGKELKKQSKVTESVEDLRLRLVRENATRRLNSTTGSSLFESTMIKTLNEIDNSNVVLESGEHLLNSEKNYAALMQTILEYTTLEMFNTMKIYDFDARTVGQLKRM